MLCFIMVCSSWAGNDNTAMADNKNTIDVSLKLTQHEQDIEKLGNSVKSVKTSVNKLEDKLSENNEESIFPSILILVLVVILSAIGGFYIRELVKDVTNLRKEVDSLEKKLATLEKKLVKKDEKYPIYLIKNRLEALEKQLQQLPKTSGARTFPNAGEPGEQRPSTTASETTEKENSTKVGYFDYPIESDKGNFFQEFHEYSSDRSKFKAWITDDRGEFEPYELIRIKAYFFPPDVLENTDSKVTVTDSTGFVVLEKGKVRKEGDKWIIEKPVKVIFK